MTSGDQTSRANHACNDQRLQAHVFAQADSYAAQFAPRQPFRHVVIDDFFSAGFCAELLAQFPAFERGNARNEGGALGGKAIVQRIRALGGAYAALDDLIKSREFLDLAGRITGIENLLYDPWYFGGGTHENRNGQSLDAHVDFNRHPKNGWHRRLNLIVYLNPQWEDAWGGALELHSDPRSPDDRVLSIVPAYNRGVIFETTESSWHAFPEIRIPPSANTASRRSLAFYFYSTERPPAETFDAHSTIYVDRPLPDRIRAGVTLTQVDVDELRELLARRDQHNERLYNEARVHHAQLGRMQLAVNAGWLGRVRYLAQRFAELYLTRR